MKAFDLSSTDGGSTAQSLSKPAAQVKPFGLGQRTPNYEWTPLQQWSDAPSALAPLLQQAGLRGAYGGGSEAYRGQSDYLAGRDDYAGYSVGATQNDYDTGRGTDYALRDAGGNIIASYTGEPSHRSFLDKAIDFGVGAGSALVMGDAMAGGSAVDGLSGMDLAADGAASSGNAYGTGSGAFGGFGEIPMDYSVSLPEGMDTLQTSGAQTYPVSPEPSGAGLRPEIAESGAGEIAGGNGLTMPSTGSSSFANGTGSALPANFGTAAPATSPSFMTGLEGTLGKTGTTLLSAALLQQLQGKPPAAPDAGAITAAQTAANTNAAQTSNQMNRVDTTTPYGSQTFGAVADSSVPGGFRYTQNIALSPEQQQLYNLETGNQIGKAQIGSGLQNNVANAVSSPFSLSAFDPLKKVTSGAAAFSAEREKVTSALYDRLTRLRGPQMERDVSALDAKLRNQGLMPGTAAYDNGMRSLREAQGTELSNLADQAVTAGGAEQSRLAGLDMQGAGFNNTVQQNQIQQALLGRTQPLQELNSFMTGNSPTLPTFQPFGMAQTQPANVGATAQQQYNGQTNTYNAQTGNLQSLLNLFGILNKGP